jgi:hypothetical protein
MTRRSLLAAIAASLALATPATAALRFQPVSTVANAGGPVAVEHADLNGDGRPDLVTANPGTNNVAVLINRTLPGSAQFQSVRSAVALAGADAVTAIAVGDINGDGRPDIVAADGGATDVLHLFYNQTDDGAASATFNLSSQLTPGDEPSAIALADFNLDGRLDIAVTSQTNSQVGVFLNTTPPGFSATFSARNDFAIGSLPKDIVAADFNSDGRPDLATANSGGTASITLLSNTTAPNAAAPSFGIANFNAAGGTGASIAAGDLNRDGRIDLVFGKDGTSVQSTVRNDAATGLVAANVANLDLGGMSRGLDVDIADVDRDGIVDAVFAGSVTSEAIVAHNDTAANAASFTLFVSAAVAVSAGGSTRGVDAADLNADGALDLATADPGTNSTGVALNAPDPVMTPAGTFQFGTVPLGTLSAAQTVTVTNNGAAPLLGAPLLGGANPEDFLVTADSCVGGGGFNGSGQCNLQVRFGPTGTQNTARSATLLPSANTPTAVTAAALGGTAGTLPAGTPGPTGATGAAGDTGATGAPGPAGRNATVTCKPTKAKIKGKTIRIRCTVKLAPAAARVSMRLTKNGRVVARGSGRRASRATLTARRGLRPGRYRLVAVFRDGAGEVIVVVRQTVSLG